MRISGVFACASPLFLRGFIGRRYADTARHSSGVIAEKWRRAPWVLDRSVSSTMNSPRVLATSSRAAPFFRADPSRTAIHGGSEGEKGLEFRWQITLDAPNESPKRALAKTTPPSDYNRRFLLAAVAGHRRGVVRSRGIKSGRVPRNGASTKFPHRSLGTAPT